MFTAGQAGYTEFDVVVADWDGERAYRIRLTPPNIQKSCGSATYLEHLNHHSHLLAPESDGGTESQESGSSRSASNPDGTSQSNAAPDVCERTWRKVLDHPERDEKNRFTLTIALDMRGIDVSSTGSTLPPRDGCPDDGPTICLENDATDVEGEIRRIRKLLGEKESDARERASTLLAEVRRAYDWRRLYETLVQIKAEHPHETLVKVTAKPEIPLELLVRMVDVSRFVLPRHSFESDERFRNAFRNDRRYLGPTGNLLIPQVLFSDPVLAVAF